MQRGCWRGVLAGTVEVLKLVSCMQHVPCPVPPLSPSPATIDLQKRMLSRFWSLVTALALHQLVCGAALPSRAAARSSSAFRNIAYWAYFQADNKPYDPLPLIQNPSHVTDLYLFSIDLHTTAPNLTIGGVAPTNSSFLGDLWGEVAQFQAAGVKVIASLGGYQTEAFILLQNDFSKWYPILLDFLKKYKLDGIDLDIEPSASGQTPTGITSSLKLIQQLRKDLPADFVISMAPVAADLTSSPPEYSGFNYKQLDNAAVDSSGKHQINFFAGQFYNGWGDCGDTATYDQIIQNGYDPSRVAFGVLADSEDGNGFCSLATVQSTIKSLRKKYPSMGGVGE